jgi:uncharacterized protein YukE
MDLDRVRQLLADLVADRERLVELIARAKHAVAKLGESWTGPDAVHFDAGWADQQALLHDCVAMLEQMAKVLTAQIDQQKGTSAS